MLLSEIRQMIDRAIAEHGDMEAVTQVDGYATPFINEIKVETWPVTWHADDRDEIEEPIKLAVIGQTDTHGYLKREHYID